MVVVRDAAHAAYRASEPQVLGVAKTDIPPQRVHYKTGVPIDAMTTDYLLLGGGNIFKILPEIIQRLAKAEAKIAQLEKANG